jgi:hypothetical protein
MWNAKKTECWAQHRSNEIYILRAPHKAFNAWEPPDEVFCGHLDLNHTESNHFGLDFGSEALGSMLRRASELKPY